MVKRLLILALLTLIPIRVSSADASPMHRTRYSGYPATFLVTAYAFPSICGASGFTASGQWPHIGGAAGPRWMMGQHVTVPGWGTVTINDTGGAVGANHIDLFMGNCYQARAWGTRYLRVFVW